MNNLPVLIVGAGPTGLMMACELARRHIPFRIIDKNAKPTAGSNATWIQTRTLEIFDNLGIAHHFLKIGHRCHSINLYANGKQVVTIPLDNINSPYPFILMLPQAETERLLSEYLKSLNGKIERSLELIDIQQEDDKVISALLHSDGRTEKMISHWLIACDGAHSTVRNKCQLEFKGKDLPEQFMVADAKMSSYLPENEIHVFFDKGTIFPDKATLFGAFPSGSNNYRINANLYLSHPRKSFIEQEVKEIVVERGRGNYVVDSVSWIEPFWIHSKIVKHMRHGSIFLAGDAAHIHSPAGGQGMNLGLQDAYNLAWKLALVIQGHAHPSLLDSYQSERYPVVKDIVRQTERLTNMVLFDENFFAKLDKFSEKIARCPKRMSKKIGMQLTQLSIQYDDSPVINYQDKIGAKSPQPGEKVFDVAIDPSTRFYDYLRNMQHNIFIFTGLSEKSDAELSDIFQLQNSLRKAYPRLCNIYVVTKKNLDNVANVIVDAKGVLHKHYNAKSGAIYVIRPDNYIAYCSDKLDSIQVEEFLKKYLIMQ